MPLRGALHWPRAVAVGALSLLVPLTVACAAPNMTSGTSSPETSEPAAAAFRSGPFPDSEPVTGEPRTWIAMACEPDTYIDGSSALTLATATGMCRSKQSTSSAQIDLNFGQFRSQDAWEQEAMQKPDTYVIEAYTPDGGVFVAMSPYRSRPLEILAAYGFVVRQLPDLW